MVRKNIKLSESETLELKLSLSQIKEIIQTLVAFANTSGGKVLVGVSDRGGIVGLDIGQNTLENLVNEIKQHTEPALYSKIRVKTIKTKKIIEVGVDESKSKPVLAFGQVFKRVGKSTIKADKNELEQMILERRKVYFDSLLLNKAKLEDLSFDKVRAFVIEAKKQRNLNLDEKDPIKETLLRLKLLHENRLTNAAVLLFGKNPQLFFTQATAKAIRFKGNDVTTEMIDFKNFEGDILDQLRKSEDFIFNNIPKHAWMEERKLDRQEKWLFPPQAIREALANAFAHRDYESSSMIQIRIFDDRMEIWNPGSLPSKLNIQRLKEEHESIPANPLIAKALFWIRYAEEVGTGTNKIIKWCKDWGLPEPRFDDTGSSFVVVFYVSKLTPEFFEKMGLNERQKKALEYLKNKKIITNREYLKINAVSRVLAFKEISDLVEKKIIVREGKGRSSEYRLVSN